jgi:glycosyltransferase involved in cell wall biosynthesis
VIRWVLGVRIRDLDCAFKVFRREVIEEIEMTSNGAAINAEIMSQIQRNRCKMRQIPVSHYERTAGAPTGANIKVILKAFRELPRLWPFRVRRFTKAQPVTPSPARLQSNGTIASHLAISANGTNGQHLVNGARLTNGTNGTNGHRLANGTNGAGEHGSTNGSTNGSVSSTWIKSAAGDAEERKLKVCMLAACPFPANHGTPGSIREISEAIAGRGHDVHIVTYHMGQDIPVNGPQVHRITPLTRESGVVVGPTSRRPLYDLQLVFKTLEVIRRHKPDIIHAHGYEAGLAAWMCKMATGLPVVYSGHNTMADELPTYKFIKPQWLAVGLARLLDAIVPRLADRCIPHSLNMEGFFHEMGLKHRTDAVINFGIDLQAMPPTNTAAIRERFGLGDAPVIVYAGVMDEFQCLELLLESMKQVLAHEPRAKLLLIVTIPCEKHLARVRRQAQELGIADSVVLTEPQPLNSVLEILPACDVAVVPRPKAPGFPIKLLNYMATRRACVLYASSSSGLVHRENAYLVVPDTSEALGQGIVEVLKDDTLRQRLARNGYQFVLSHHDRRLTAQQICTSYFRTLAQIGRQAALVGRPALELSEGAGVRQSADEWTSEAAESATTPVTSHATDRAHGLAGPHVHQRVNGHGLSDGAHAEVSAESGE